MAEAEKASEPASHDSKADAGASPATESPAQQSGDNAGQHSSTNEQHSGSEPGSGQGEGKQEHEEDEEAKQRRQELASKVAAADAEIERLQKILDERTDEVDKGAADADAVRSSLKEAQEKHNAAAKAHQDAEKEKAELLPTYEQCLSSKEQKDRGSQYRREIAELERQLKANEEEVTRLDREMTSVSARYADGKSALESFTKSLGDSLDGVLGGLRDKIAKTIEVPPLAAGETETEQRKALAQTLALNPFDVLDGLEAIVREREREFSHASRQLRELTAICEMKAEEEEKLSSGTAGSIDTKKKDNDEFIKNLIYGFQDLRANLQADIEEIRKVNKDQAFNLRRGHYEKKDSGVFTPRTAAGSASGVTPRQSSFRKEPEKTKEILAMEKSNQELHTELSTLKKKLHEATIDRTDSLKTLKGLEHRLEQDRIRFQEDLHKAESDYAAKRIEIERLEKENRRLAETVEHLTAVVDTTRKQVNYIRSHHDPLPIEDNKAA